jgi:Putative peptidoglycan binding domain.
MSDLTEAEIRSFQQARGLDVTGFVDAVTERALEKRGGNLGIAPYIFKVLN